MSDKTQNRDIAKSSTPDATANAAAGGDLGVAEVQERVDRENEQGFVGVEVDPTPNENYTLQGVTSGAPTPETDEKAAADAQKASGRR